MALDKRAWRCQKGHGAQEKGHGAAPCCFALDLTLIHSAGTHIGQTGQARKHANQTDRTFVRQSDEFRGHWF